MKRCVTSAISAVVTSAIVVAAIVLSLGGCATGPRAGEDVREAGATRAADFRSPGPRAMETIFSPLDLPTPSDERLASGMPGPGYWQQRADYVIEATLDAEKRTLTGKGRVTYTNNSPHALDYLWVHLEQNLFRGESLGALSSEPRTRFGHHGFEGGVTVKSLRAANGGELVYRIYDTLARVDLPRAIEAKGGRFEFEVEWSFAIPPYGADRMGIDDCEQGPVFELAQWFPAVAVYDDAHGWNTQPYLGQGEFYTNFGDFEVRLTVPRSHIVVATGVLQNQAEVLTAAQRERWEAAKKSATAVQIVKPEEVGKAESRPGGDGPLTWVYKARMCGRSRGRRRPRSSGTRRSWRIPARRESRGRRGRCASRRSRRRRCRCGARSRRTSCDSRSNITTACGFDIRIRRR